MYAIKANVLFDGYRKLRDVYIVIEDKLIKDITNKKPGTEVLFEGVVTPAFIDGHSHIGMARHSEPSSEEEVNEQADIYTPDLDPLDSVYFDDKYFEDAVEFGVLYSCIHPGSGNLIGGKAVVIRNYAKNREEAPIKYVGYKMALGYNPRSTYKTWKGKRFYTRMGVYALLHRKFHEVIKKRKKISWRIERMKRRLGQRLATGEISEDEYHKELEEYIDMLNMEFSPIDRAILEILDRKKVVKVHVHKEDDAIFLINIAKEYKIRAIADHTCDIYRKEGFEMLKNAGIPIIYGPIDALAYKTELKHDTYKNVKALIESGAKFGLMSDHPVMLARNLHLQLRYFLIYGYDEAKTISIITKENAEILGLDKFLGTIEKGKWASLLVWNNNPFYLGSRPQVVMGEGKILFEKKD